MDEWQCCVATPLHDIQCLATACELHVLSRPRRGGEVEGGGFCVGPVIVRASAAPLLEQSC